MTWNGKMFFGVPGGLRPSQRSSVFRNDIRLKLLHCGPLRIGVAFGPALFENAIPRARPADSGLWLSEQIADPVRTMLYIRSSAEFAGQQTTHGHKELFLLGGQPAAGTEGDVLLKLIAVALFEPIENIAFYRLVIITTSRFQFHR